MPSGGSLELFYVVQDAESAGPWTATILFGDGQQATVEGKTGSTQHAYACATTSCTYTATVTVENAQGARSADTQVAKLSVMVGTPPGTAAGTATSQTMY